MSSKNSNLDLENGKCFTSFVKFRDHNGTILSTGKNRPVISILDPNTNEYVMCKCTGEFTLRNSTYGYELKDWKEAGFNRPTIIKCNKDNIYSASEQLPKKSFGSLTQRDLIGFLEKLIEVREVEHERLQQRIKAKNTSFEIER